VRNFCHPEGKTYIEGVENKAQRRNLDIKGRERQESGHNCILRSFINCTLHRVVRSRKLRQMRHITHTSEVRDAHKILVEKYECKSQF
jgi:hypothetical protein